MPGRASTGLICKFPIPVGTTNVAAGDTTLASGKATIDSAAESMMMTACLSRVSASAGVSVQVKLWFNGVVIMNTVIVDNGGVGSHPVTIQKVFTPGEITPGLNGQVDIALTAGQAVGTVVMDTVGELALIGLGT